MLMLIMAPKINSPPIPLEKKDAQFSIHFKLKFKKNNIAFPETLLKIDENRR